MMVNHYDLRIRIILILLTSYPPKLARFPYDNMVYWLRITSLNRGWGIDLFLRF